MVIKQSKGKSLRIISTSYELNKRTLYWLPSKFTYSLWSHKRHRIEVKRWYKLRTIPPGTATKEAKGTRCTNLHRLQRTAGGSVICTKTMRQRKWTRSRRIDFWQRPVQFFSFPFQEPYLYYYSVNRACFLRDKLHFLYLAVYMTWITLFCRAVRF